MRDEAHFLLDESGNRRLVDGMRGLGMLLVILFHSVFGVTRLVPSEARNHILAEFPDALAIAWQALGSEIVFLFSAFLLGYLLLREAAAHGAIDIGSFYVRRLARILPLYALALVIFAPFSNVDVREAVLNVLLVSKLFGADTIVPVGWSLEVLVQVYVLLPFIVVLLLKSGRPVTLLAAGVVACLYARFRVLAADPLNYRPLYAVLLGDAPSAAQEDLYYLVGYRATPFLLGLLLAYGVVTHASALSAWLGRSGMLLAVALVSALLIACGGFLPLHDRGSWLYSVTGDEFWLWFWTAQRLVFAAGWCGLLLCLWYGHAVWLRPLRWLLEMRSLASVARDIYAIYLFHILLLLPATAIVFRTTSREAIGDVTLLDIAAIFVLGTALALLVGRLLTAFVEAPARRWLTAMAGRWRGRWLIQGLAAA